MEVIRITRIEPDSRVKIQKGFVEFPFFKPRLTPQIKGHGVVWGKADCLVEIRYRLCKVAESMPKCTATEIGQSALWAKSNGFTEISQGKFCLSDLIAASTSTQMRVIVTWVLMNDTTK